MNDGEKRIGNGDGDGQSTAGEPAGAAGQPLAGACDTNSPDFTFGTGTESDKDVERVAARRQQRLIFGCVVLAAAVLLCYGVTLQGEFVYDDPFLITENPLVTGEDVSPGDIFSMEFFGGGEGASGFYRPVMVLLYRWVYNYAGPDPFGFHLLCILMHLGAALVLMLVLVRLRVPVPMAIGGALLFAVHPVNAESVAWIAGGANAVAFLLLGLALFFMLRFADIAKTGAGGAEAAGGSGWRSFDLWLSCAAFLPALFAKETALIFLPLAVLILTCRHRVYSGKDAGGIEAASGSGSASGAPPFRAWRGWGTLVYLAPFLLFTAVYAALRIVALGHKNGADGAAASEGSLGPAAELFYGAGSAGERFLTFLASVARYTQLMLWPRDLNIVRPVTLTTSVDGEVLLGTALLLCAAGLALWGWRTGQKLLIVGGGLILFSLITVSTIIPIAYGFKEMEFPIFERHLYVAVAGAACLAVVPVGWLYRRRRVLRVSVLLVGAGLLVVLGLASAQRAGEWRDDLTLFQRGVTVYPASPTLLLNLGAAFQELGEQRKAIAAFHKAYYLDERFTMARVNEAISLHLLGETGSAKTILQEVIAQEPLNYHALDALGTILATRGDRKGALPLLAAAWRSSGKATTFGANLAYLIQELRMDAESLYLAQEHERALELAETVLKEVPGTSWAWELKGLVFEKRGDEEQAFQAYSMAVRLAQDALIAARRLVAIYRKCGQEAEALEIEMYLEKGRRKIPLDLWPSTEGNGTTGVKKSP